MNIGQLLETELDGPHQHLMNGILSGVPVAVNRAD
jgi:hypothetical protein